MHTLNSHQRALVLGGGGSAGNAWLIGVVAGLSEAGLDVTIADAIVGTSAGSTAAAQISAATPASLLADIVTTVVPQRPPSAPGGNSGASSGGVVNQLERTQRIIDEAQDAGEMRRRMGVSAIALDPDGESSAWWRETVAQRLPREDWPDGELLITAVDAETGESVVFDRRSGVDLVDAVAASCAGSFAYRIMGHPYIDGGYRANAENADLAAGYHRVLVLSPFGGRTRLPLEWRLDLATQVAALRTAGSAVEMIHPDAASLAAFGGNMMDLSTRVPAARAGHAQGLATAGELTDFWQGPEIPTIGEDRCPFLLRRRR